MAENDFPVKLAQGGSRERLTSSSEKGRASDERERLMTERRNSAADMPQLDLDVEAAPSLSDEKLRSDLRPRTTPLGRRSSAYKSSKDAFLAVVQSWASKRFMQGVAILFPVAVTFYITFWFFHFVDGFFYPIYSAVFHINIIGLGFVTTIAFIFCVGVFASSYVGASIVWLGDWLIKRVPLIKHIYSASQSISNAISPDQNVNAFKEVAIIRHPRIGEYALAFITSSLTLQHENGLEEKLVSVYVPTNHVYIGDVFLVNAKEIIRPQLSVREGIEIVVSGGMSMPPVLRPIDPNTLSPSMRPLI